MALSRVFFRWMASTTRLIEGKLLASPARPVLAPDNPWRCARKPSFVSIAWLKMLPTLRRELWMALRSRSNWSI